MQRKHLNIHLRHDVWLQRVARNDNKIKDKHKEAAHKLFYKVYNNLMMISDMIWSHVTIVYLILKTVGLYHGAYWLNNQIY